MFLENFFRKIFKKYEFMVKKIIKYVRKKLLWVRVSRIINNENYLFRDFGVLELLVIEYKVCIFE